jgi:predicted MFS family arabinose efflux permease
VLLALSLPGPRPDARSARILRSIRDGFSFSLREPGLRTIVTYMTVNALFAAPVIALIPPMALKVLDAGAGGVSALVAAQGVGAVVMALSLGSLAHRYSSGRLLGAVLWLLPLALVAYALSPTLVVAIVTIFAVGALYLGTLSSFTSVAQLRAPAYLRGRVMSVLNVLLGALYPLGSIVQGRLADTVGQRTTQVGAALAMLTIVLVLRTTRPQYLRALDEPVVIPADTAVVPS